MAIRLEQLSFQPTLLSFYVATRSSVTPSLFRTKEIKRERNVLLTHSSKSVAIFTRFYWTWHNSVLRSFFDFPRPFPKSNGRATSIIFDITHHGSRQQMFHRKSNRYLHNTFLPVGPSTCDRITIKAKTRVY